MQFKKYPDHPYSTIVPMANPADRATMREMLETNGQAEAIILHRMPDSEALGVLDGRNRQDILIDDIGVEPIYVNFDELPDSWKRVGPLELVRIRNLGRRNLTDDQKAAAAAEYIKFYEADAEQRRLAGLKQGTAGPFAPNGANGDEMNQDTGTSPADESQAPGRKKGRASEHAASQFGTSARQVQRARRVLAKDPKKHAAVKAGTKRLSAAEREVKEAEDLESAHKRIAAVCGRTFADKVKAGEALKKGAKEIVEYAAMKDEDMLKVRGLLQHGWPLKRAREYKMTALAPAHSIRDLCTRALAQGVADKGSYVLSPITIDDVPLEITVRRAKNATD